MQKQPNNARPDVEIAMRFEGQFVKRVADYLEAVIGTFLNIKINCGDCEDKDFVRDILERVQQVVDDTCAWENEIMKITNSKIN